MHWIEVEGHKYSVQSVHWIHLEIFLAGWLILQALVLEPGRVLSAFALPEGDSFTYCLECGRLGKPCALHALAATPTSAGHQPHRSGNYNRNGQRSGQCFGCGQSGHFRFECPN